MTTAGRGIRNAFRSATRTVSIILILGLAIGLAVVMLTAHRSVSDKIAAEKIYCRKHHCTVAAAYYNRLADELARTVISDKLVVEKNGTRTWPFKGRKGQARPTVDAKGILSEPCDSPVSDWPNDCKLGNSAGTYQSYLISKHGNHPNPPPTPGSRRRSDLASDVVVSKDDS